MPDDTQTKIFNLLDVLATQVGGIATRVDALATQIGGLATRVDAIAADVSDHRKETGEGFARVERRLGRTDTRVEGLEASNENLSGRVASLEKR